MNIRRMIRILAAVAVIGCLYMAPAMALTPFHETDAAVEIDYSQLDNETAVYTYLTQEMGLNRAAACGVLANIQYESGFDPTVWGDGGTSHGLCQWHNDRCWNLSRFCRENGYDENSVYGQMAYLQTELTEHYPAVLEYLQSVEDSEDGAYDAAWYWCYYFEVPADRQNQAALRGESAAYTYYPAYAD